MALEVANTILEQLGGRRFAAMVGAKNFVGSADALSFRLPSNFAKDGINAVRVTLTPADLYNVEFSRVRGTKITSVAKDEGVYCDELQAIFLAATGLHTRF